MLRLCRTFRQQTTSSTSGIKVFTTTPSRVKISRIQEEGLLPPRLLRWCKGLRWWKTSPSKTFTTEVSRRSLNVNTCKEESLSLGLCRRLHVFVKAFSLGWRPLYGETVFVKVVTKTSILEKRPRLVESHMKTRRVVEILVPNWNDILTRSPIFSVQSKYRCLQKLRLFKFLFRT